MYESVKAKLQKKYDGLNKGFAGTIFGMPVTTELTKEELIGVIILAGDQELILRKLYEGELAMREIDVISNSVH